jgi:hypothetical protein
MVIKKEFCDLENHIKLLSMKLGFSRHQSHWLMFTLLAMQLPFLVQAQSKPSSIFDLLYVEAKMNYGYILPHHNEIWGLSSGFFPSAEVSIFRQTDGRRQFHYLRKYPQIGITYRYSDFGGSASLGVMNALMPVVNMPVISKGKSRVLFSMGAGLAYLSKKFDPFDNYQNLTIGSHLNAAIKFELIFQQKVSNRVYLNSGVSMFHISNGTIKTPNFGLNIPSVFGAVQWKLSKNPIQFKVPDIKDDNKGKLNFRLMGSLASKQLFGLPEKDFRVTSVAATLLYYYKNTARLTIGSDFVHDESVKHRMLAAGDATTNWRVVTKKGVNVGHEWVFSHLSISINLGYYFDKPLANDYLIYNKIGLNYSFIDQLFVAVNLYTHWAKADFLSFGMGVTL